MSGEEISIAVVFTLVGGFGMLALQAGCRAFLDWWLDFLETLKDWAIAVALVWCVGSVLLIWAGVLKF